MRKNNFCIAILLTVLFQSHASNSQHHIGLNSFLKQYTPKTEYIYPVPKRSYGMTFDQNHGESLLNKGSNSQSYRTSAIFPSPKKRAIQEQQPDGNNPSTENADATGLDDKTSTTQSCTNIEDIDELQLSYNPAFPPSATSIINLNNQLKLEIFRLQKMLLDRDNCIGQLKAAISYLQNRISLLNKTITRQDRELEIQERELDLREKIIFELDPPHSSELESPCESDSLSKESSSYSENSHNSLDDSDQKNSKEQK